MNKYFSIIATSFKQERKTLTNSIVSVISFIITIFIFFQLWGYIYGGDGGGTLLNGYTLEMMIWYLIVAEVLSYSTRPRGITKAYSNDIKSGKIAYMLNKPYNYFCYQVSSQVGIFLWNLCFLIPAGVLIGVILLGKPLGFSFLFCLPMLLCIFLACILCCLVYGIIGMLSFWVEESTPFAWIMQKFVLILGLFFPPEFFPAWLQPIIIYSPIYAMCSGPSKLVTNFSWQDFGQVVIIQLVYIVLVSLIGVAIYKSGTKKVNINGG